MSDFRRVQRDFETSLFAIGLLAVWLFGMYVLLGWVGLLVAVAWPCVGVVVGLTVGRLFEEEE